MQSRLVHHRWHCVALLTAYSIGTTCPKKSAAANVEDNPLLHADSPAAHNLLPRFRDVESHHVKTAVDHQLNCLRGNFDRLSADIKAGEANDYASIIEELERMKGPMSSTLATVEHLLMVDTSDDMTFAHNMSQSSTIQLLQEMAQSKTVLSGLQNLRSNTQSWESLSSSQRAVVTALIKDMQRNAVDLSDAAKEQFNALQMTLSSHQAKFNNNVQKSSRGFIITLKKKSSVESMPHSLKRSLACTAEKEGYCSATPEEGPWVVSLDSYHPCMQHLRSRRLREALFRAHAARVTTSPHDNTSLVHSILRDRQALARLFGFKTYADLSLDAKMAPSVAAALDLLGTLRDKALPLARREMVELTDFMRTEEGKEAELAEWDVPYWSERLKEARFGFSEDEVAAFLPLEGVLRGLFALVEKLFSVRIQERVLESRCVWNPDVRFFEVYNAASASTDTGAGAEPIAAFFLDPFSRPRRKKEGNWMSPVVGRSAARGQAMPVAHLVLNIPPPLPTRGGSDSQALMTLAEVETLFHETGHALQHLLTKVEEEPISGINNVEWDAVEFPSQFMENWVYHKETLRSFAKHHSTGEPLSLELCDKIVAARQFQAGSRLLRQLRMAALDLDLHSEYDPESGQTPLHFAQSNASLRKYSFPQVGSDLELSSTLFSFSHIFSGGYAAGYYSYIWAEMMSADAFAAFEEGGLEDEAAVRETGRRFRDTVLALGGGKDSSKVFRLFRGRGVSAEALLRHRGLEEKKTERH